MNWWDLHLDGPIIFERNQQQFCRDYLVLPTFYTAGGQCHISVDITISTRFNSYRQKVEFAPVWAPSPEKVDSWQTQAFGSRCLITALILDALTERILCTDQVPSLSRLDGIQFSSKLSFQKGWKSKEVLLIICAFIVNSLSLFVFLLGLRYLLNLRVSEWALAEREGKSKRHGKFSLLHIWIQLWRCFDRFIFAYMDDS